MILTNDLHELQTQYDFIDSIVTNVYWSDDLMDLVIEVDYYWDYQEGRETTRELRLILRRCSNAIFSMPRISENLNDEELASYSLSWYTILSSEFIVNDSIIKVLLYTMDYDTVWLAAECQEVLLDGEKF